MCVCVYKTQTGQTTTVSYIYIIHSLCSVMFILKGVSPYIRAKFRMLLNKGNISREHSERIQFATA